MDGAGRDCGSGLCFTASLSATGPTKITDVDLCEILRESSRRLAGGRDQEVLEATEEGAAGRPRSPALGCQRGVALLRWCDVRHSPLGKRSERSE
jgi:hypothetical protein